MSGGVGARQLGGASDAGSIHAAGGIGPTNHSDGVAGAGGFSWSEFGGAHSTPSVDHGPNQRILCSRKKAVSATCSNNVLSPPQMTSSHPPRSIGLRFPGPTR